DIPGIGKMSLSDAATSMVTRVGNASRHNKTEQEAAMNVLNENESQRISVSGVDSNEEEMNLLTYTQVYNSNLKVISTGNQIFADLLALF
ncbi:MAG: flagellar basal body rod C-terminal domain-containing protein, partial [Enterobacteriaceae bacterium]